MPRAGRKNSGKTPKEAPSKSALGEAPPMAKVAVRSDQFPALVVLTQDQLIALVRDQIIHALATAMPDAIRSAPGQSTGIGAAPEVMTTDELAEHLRFSVPQLAALRASGEGPP